MIDISDDELKKSTGIPHDFDVIFVEKNGKYTSVTDTTWFEEELKKNDKIKYYEGVDYYKVVGPRGFNLAYPGNIIIRCFGKYCVISKSSMLIYLLLCYGKYLGPDQEPDSE